jgi:hypothetical protein
MLTCAVPASDAGDLHPHSIQRSGLRKKRQKQQNQAIHTVNAPCAESPIATDCDSAAK